MKNIILILLLIALPVTAHAGFFDWIDGARQLMSEQLAENVFGANVALNTFQGGTGTTSPSGILYGDGTIRLKTVVIGSGITWDGTTLSASGGSGSWPFTPETYYGQAVQSTSTALRLTNSPFSLFASSTALFQQASSTLSTVSDTLYTQTIKGCCGGATYLELNAADVAIFTTSSLKLNLNGTSADVFLEADVTSDKTFTFPNFTGTFCLIDVNCTGTSTAYTWSALQTFGSGFISNSSSTVSGDLTAKGYFTSYGDTTGTSTFYGNVEVKGNLRDDSISSALLFGDGIGEVVEYSGTTCTNQFVRSLNGAGVATCETVSLTADVTGTLPVANGGTGSTTLSTNLLRGNGTGVVNSFAGTSCTNQFVSALNGAGVATCATVDISANTNLAVTAPIVLTGDTVSIQQTPSFSFPAGARSATTTTATTTVALGAAWFAETWSGVACWSGSGTVPYQFSDGTNKMNSLLATGTVSRFALSTNNTFVADEKRFVDIGPMTNSYLSCTVLK